MRAPPERRASNSEHFYSREPVSMGIRGLTGFIEENFAGWKRTRVTGNLIIDGYSVCHTMYHEQGINSVYGGDYVTFANHIKEFFRALLSSGVTPYVVFDGIDLDEKKKETHLERRSKDISRVWKLMHGQSLSERFLPYFARQVMVEVVRSIDGVCFHIADDDADSYLAGMAIALNGPVLSTDSDFFVFPIPSGYIPYVNLSWRGWRDHPIVANVYTHTAFINQLGLTDPALLTLIPAVMGNDTMPALEDFTRRVLMKGKPCDLKLTHLTVSSVIQFANRFTSHVECTMSVYKSTQHSHENPLANMQEAYDFYYASVHKYSNLNQKPSLRCKEHCVIPDFVVERFVEGKIPNLLMDAICLRDVDLRVAAEDLTSSWCHQIGIPVRKVIYGIICKKDGELLEYQRCLGNYKDYKHIKMKVTTQLEYNNETVQVPRLLDIPAITLLEKKSMLYGALECSEVMFSQFSADLHLVLAITRFWRLYCDTSLNPTNLISVLIISLMVDPPKEFTQATDDVLYKHWTVNVSIMTELTCGHLLQFVHAFAQWQSLYHDVYCLNQLLLEPVKLFGIYKFFEGTKMYSCFKEILDLEVTNVVLQKNLNLEHYTSMYQVVML